MPVSREKENWTVDSTPAWGFDQMVEFPFFGDLEDIFISRLGLLASGSDPDRRIGTLHT